LLGDKCTNQIQLVLSNLKGSFIPISNRLDHRNNLKNMNEKQINKIIIFFVHVKSNDSICSPIQTWGQFNFGIGFDGQFQFQNSLFREKIELELINLEL